MLRPKKYFNFPNVTAVLALFIALGGTSYAVSKVNGKDLVDGSVTGKKLAKDTLTGKQIKEKKLGAVPLSDETAHLLIAGVKQPKVPKKLAGGAADSSLVPLSKGDSTTLLTSGPFTYTATCRDVGGGSFLADVTLESTEAGSVTNAGDAVDQTFGPGDPSRIGRALGTFSEPGTVMKLNYGTFAIAPSGASVVLGDFYVGASVAGADCVYLAYGIS